MAMAPDYTPNGPVRITKVSVPTNPFVYGRLGPVTPFGGPQARLDRLAGVGFLGLNVFVFLPRL